MTETSKRHQLWELRMIGEWLAQTFPDAEWRTNVRLGELQPRDLQGRYTYDELAGLGVWRRWVDAIVILPDRLLLVEAVLRAHPGKLSVLDLYESLVPHTPELAAYHDRRVQKILLYAVPDPAVDALAGRHQILAIQYVPTFVDAWLATLRPRDQRAPRNY